MQEVKIRFNCVIVIFIILVTLVYGCSTTNAIKNRYQANRKGEYDISEEVKEITHAVGDDIIGVFHFLGKGITYFGRGVEKTGEFLQGKHRKKYNLTK